MEVTSESFSYTAGGKKMLRNLLTMTSYTFCAVGFKEFKLLKPCPVGIIA